MDHAVACAIGELRTLLDLLIGAGPTDGDVDNWLLIAAQCLEEACRFPGKAPVLLSGALELLEQAETRMTLLAAEAAGNG